MQNAYLIGIGGSIRIGREIRCLPYARLFYLAIQISIFTNVWRTNMKITFYESCRPYNFNSEPALKILDFLLDSLCKLYGLFCGVVLFQY